ncbi:hypothetical protein C5167_046349 [Papaver somniferum]|uniref:Uncharacterized protein n=1 Tax=Papaver somniferum TaxID=3469 RepID=A0A4Y7LDI7_PAPSO|nr:uncharacterized protein LOC113323228 [Papaver somniferum]RZC83563.1 hypothetical protein C5167_046349 [Papaver somniferum]
MDLQIGNVINLSPRLKRKRSCRFSSGGLSSPYCSKSPPGEEGNKNKGDRFSTDWDKAWSSFRKRGKKSLFSQFNPNKYVSWNPKRSNFPLSEEVDPIKRAERSNLMLWTSPKFTLAGAIVVVTLLLIYTFLAPMK